MTPLLDRAAQVRTVLHRLSSRILYRCIDFERWPSIDLSHEGTPAGRINWARGTVRFGIQAYAPLVCSPNSSVAYDVVLPNQAIVESSVAVTSETTDAKSADGILTFEVRIRVNGLESSHRVLVDPKRRTRWQRMRLLAPGAGPARITLSTVASSPVSAGLQALWGNPRVQSRRSLRQLVSVARGSISEWGIRAAILRAVSTPDQRYRVWVRESVTTRVELRRQKEWASTLRQPVTFSLITFVSSTDDLLKRRSFESLLSQSYPHWEWVVVTASPDKNGTGHQTNDERVRVLSATGCHCRGAAWNLGVDTALGVFIALLDADDALSPSALYEVAKHLEQTPECDLLYSDEDRLSPSGWRRSEPRFKPEWSPDLLLTSNYIGRLAVARKSVVVEAGAFSAQYDGGEEWDLLLRLSRQNVRARRIPRCLYHQTGNAPAIPESVSTAVLENHGRALGLDASVTQTPEGPRIVWPVSRTPLVSIVIPNRDAPDIIVPCVHGVLNRTAYPNLELVVVDNGSSDARVLDLYRTVEERGGVVVPFNRSFNFSQACNVGAAAGRGDLLLFLNNDIEVVHPDWLDELVRWAQQPDMGIVGAKLLYPDLTIQHAGVVFGIGLVGHIYSRSPEHTHGLFGSTDSYRNYSGVTGACQMMRRDVFARLNGYDERLRLSFSDIVMCLEAWRAGYRVLYTPHARLIHHESYTRKRDDRPEDLRLFAEYLDRIGFTEDPYFHPELDSRSPVPRLRPPFATSPEHAVRDYVDRALAASSKVVRADQISR